MMNTPQTSRLLCWSITKKQNVLEALVSLSSDGISKQMASQALDEGRVLINQSPVKWRQIFVFPGDELCLKPTPPPLEEIRVLFQHEHYWVINKPAGWVSSLEREKASLGSWEPASQVPGLVHRLDAQTSGVMILPVTVSALQKWTDAFRDQKITKIYLAFVNGVWSRGERWCRAPIARHPHNPREFTTHTSFRAKPASTFFQPCAVEKQIGVSAMLCMPHTGRTHQIRLHLCEEGTPLLGDQLYGTQFPHPLNVSLPRHALHAFALKFVCPFDRVQRVVSAPFSGDLKTCFEKWFDFEQIEKHLLSVLEKDCLSKKDSLQ